MYAYGSRAVVIPVKPLELGLGSLHSQILPLTLKLKNISSTSFAASDNMRI